MRHDDGIPEITPADAARRIHEHQQRIISMLGDRKELCGRPGQLPEHPCYECRKVIVPGRNKFCTACALERNRKQAREFYEKSKIAKLKAKADQP